MTCRRAPHERASRKPGQGTGGAGHFYESLGYTYAGGIPDYALDPDGRPMKNAIYYKILAP